jgi:hypothetical protein
LRQEVEEEEAVLRVYSARFEVDHGDGASARSWPGAHKFNQEVETKEKGRGFFAGGTEEGKRRLGFPGDPRRRR